MSLGTLLRRLWRTDSSALTSVVCVPVTPEEFAVLATGLQAVGRCWVGTYTTKYYAESKAPELVERAGVVGALRHPWLPLSEREVRELADVRRAVSSVLEDELGRAVGREAAADLLPAFNRLMTTLECRLGAARVLGWDGVDGPDGLVWTNMPTECESWAAWA